MAHLVDPRRVVQLAQLDRIAEEQRNNCYPKTSPRREEKTEADEDHRRIERVSRVPREDFGQHAGVSSRTEPENDHQATGDKIPESIPSHISLEPREIYLVSPHTKITNG